MRSTFRLADRSDDMWGITRRECVAMQADDNESELLEKVYRAHERNLEEKSLVLIEGTHVGRHAGLSCKLH